MNNHLHGNNNNNLFDKQQNEWFVPQILIVTKLIEAGQDEHRNTLEN